MRSALFLIALSLAVSPQVRGPWESSPAEADLAAELLELLNTAREDVAAAPLQSSATLAHLAYQHAREMATRGAVTHHSHLYGVSTSTRVKTAFPTVMQFGENVASNRTPSALHSALMRSSGHRANRLDPTFTHAGIGIARANEHQLYLAEVFVRIASDEQIASIEVLYSELAPADLPGDAPEYGQARSDALRIGAPNEDNPAYWTQRGIDAYRVGRFGEAIRHFREALRLDPDYRFASFDLARALIADGHSEEALDILDKHLQAHPDDLDAWSSRGAAALMLQRYAEAEEAYRNVLVGRARDAGSWYNFGLALEMQGDMDGAERAFRQALSVDPELAAAEIALARVQR